MSEHFFLSDSIRKILNVGFNGSHLAKIVANAGWEEKLRKVLTKDVLELLAKKNITHNKLVKLLIRKNWKEEIDKLIKKG